MAAPPHRRTGSCPACGGACASSGSDPSEEERGRRRSIVDGLDADGPMTRHQLRARLDAEGVPTAGQALVHLLAAASLRGHVVRGPMVAGHHAFVSVDTWLGPPPARPTAPRTSTAWSGAIWSATHRPAGGPGAVGGHHPRRRPPRPSPGRPTELRETDDGAVLRRRSARPRPAAPRARLLGPFDPVLHGWASREPFVGVHRSVVTTNGIFRAGVPGGRAGGGHLDAAVTGSRSSSSWRRSAPRTGPALVADADDVVRFLGHGGGR